MSWNIQLIEPDTFEHMQMLMLRNQILRIPLGIEMGLDELERDKGSILIGVYDRHNSLLACCLLEERVPGTKLQLRQMAVDTPYQRKGVGGDLLHFAEKTAVEKGYKSICLHARVTALDFYKHKGYKVAGEQFVEVGIPHVEMQKELN